MTFSAVVVSIGAVIHRALNANVVGGHYVLLAGIGFGVLLLVTAASIIYCMHGTLKVFPEPSGEAEPWQEKTAWYPAALMIVLAGVLGVSYWNSEGELRPSRYEEWQVAYNGVRPQGLLYFVASRRTSANRANVIALERDGRKVSHFYDPDLNKRLLQLPEGKWVNVRLKMGPLGLFRVEDVEPCIRASSPTGSDCERTL